jgi:hypothetical protein
MKIDIDSVTNEVLSQFGSKQRFTGVVDHIDLAGTTAFIKSGDSTFLAFVLPENLKPGQQISFRIDGQRAVDCEQIPEPLPQGEYGMEEALTPMQLAFRRVQTA